MAKITICFLMFVAAALAAPSNSPNLGIVGGHDALPGQFPYQVSLQACILGTLCSHTCGATIISPNWILTAAHCILDSSLYSYKAIVGITQLNENTANKQTINVQSFVVHPNYVNNGEVGPDDIALMRLSQSIRYNNNVQPARLGISEPSGNAVLSGWGAMGGNQMPNNLQTVTIPIITINQCFNALQSILPVGTNIPLDFQGNVCTGPLSQSISACSGDSGGPLAQNGTVVGVVSWGISPCGVVGAPSVFAKVSHYLNWIRQYVQDTDTVDLKLTYY